MEIFIRRVRFETSVFALIGFVVGLIIIASMFGLESFFDFLGGLLPNILLGLVGLFCSIYFLSIPFGKLLYNNKINPYLLGFSMTILCLELGTFTGSLFGYFGEGLDQENGFFDYIIKPVAGILFWGFIPVMILSIILGGRFSILREKKKS